VLGERLHRSSVIITLSHALFLSLLKYCSAYNEVNPNDCFETGKEPDMHAKYSFNIGLN